MKSSNTTKKEHQNVKNKNSYFEYRISVARRAEACKNYTQEEFKNYLLNIGLAKYERSILPIENNIGVGYGTPPERPQHFGRAKIIPFPGVSLVAHNQPDNFQNELDEFLREMGYIE